MQSRRRALRLLATVPFALKFAPPVKTGETWRARKRFATVLGSRMAYVEMGSGDPVIFLHGNPTSSYVWRKVLPYATSLGRCIAPDLIGMGDSDKLSSAISDRYRYLCHARYLDGLLDALGVRSRVTLVVHDWGSILGFDWARRHPERVKAIAHMEAFVDSHRTGYTPAFAMDWFRDFRREERGRLLLQRNGFVENVLIRGIESQLTEEDKAEYRRPYLNSEEDRLPTLIWPREVPLDGDPADVDEVFQASHAYMAKSRVPKLFINATPGGLVGVDARRNICRAWPNTGEVQVFGNHFIQEQSPHEIGSALRQWLQTV